MKYRKPLLAFLLVVTAAFGLEACSSSGDSKVPASIRAIFDKPLYSDSVWGLRVQDLDTGEVLINYRPDYDFLIGSVRKIFSVGELFNELGPDHLFITPIYKRGEVDGAGVLDGDLILVASGDISMGGRTKEDGQFAITDFDHNEASSFGNAVLTKPDPLEGYKAIAQQIAASGIIQVNDVVIDDRLWEPYSFRGEFDMRSIFVNDDCVDLIMSPGSEGMPAVVDWRPRSAALGVVNHLVTSGPGTEFTLGSTPGSPPASASPAARPPCPDSFRWTSSPRSRTSSRSSRRSGSRSRRTTRVRCSSSFSRTRASPCLPIPWPRIPWRSSRPGTRIPRKTS